MEGCVFNVQKYSIHDGPGIRTIIFFKGCPLRCKWCSNPESQLSQPQIAYNSGKCIGQECLLCADVCPQKNIAVLNTGEIGINQKNCIHCLRCANVCPAKAITVYGDYQTAERLIDRVEEDSVFYARSTGGLTLSGGEPTLQTEFAVALLKEAKRRGLTTAIETCGAVPWEICREVYSYLDFVYFDIKHLDQAKHKSWTGFDNTIILDTFRKMRAACPQIPCVVRTPIIPDFNDTEAEIAAIRDFVKAFPDTAYEVLRYHRYGTAKYAYLGRQYTLGTKDLDEKLFNHLQTISLQ